MARSRPMRTSKGAISGPELAARQGQAERHKQAAALAAGAFLQDIGERAPGLASPIDGLGRRRRVADEQAVVAVEVGPLDRPVEHRLPVGIVAQMDEIAAQQQPVGLARAGGQAGGNIGEIEMMQ